jgi:hypothetical protein
VTGPARPLRFARFRRWSLCPLLAAALLALATCGPRQAPPRPSGAALWVAPDSRPLGANEVARLERLGASELFVESATLRWAAHGPELEPLAGARPPRRMRGTLVVTGTWPETPPRGEAPARQLAPSLRGLAAEAERQRLLPTGIHFDLDGLASSSSVTEYGRFLGRLRRELAPDLRVSATLPASWLGSPQARRVATGVDFLVAFLYGQRGGEEERPGAWDLAQVRQGLQRLDALRTPYLLGVVTTGTVTAVGPSGQRLGTMAGGVPLRRLAWSPALKASVGSALQGLDRQVYLFEAQSPVRLGDLEVPRGGTVRIVGTSTPHLEELLRVARAPGLEHYLGEILYRLPAPADEHSLQPSQLLSALAGEGALPAPRVEIETLSRQGRRWVVKVILENRTSEPSDLSTLDHNYVELRLAGASLGEVAAGDFLRWGAWAPRGDGELVRVLRGATVLRLFAPVLPAGGRLESGAVELRLTGSGEPRLVVEARFLAHYGREVGFGPEPWPPD